MNEVRRAAHDVSRALNMLNAEVTELYAALDAVEDRPVSYAPEERTLVEYLEDLVDAEVAVQFTYENQHGELSYRHLSPYEATADHVLGWDHDRQAIRRFRVDRMGIPVPLEGMYREPE